MVTETSMLLTPHQLESLKPLMTFIEVGFPSQDWKEASPEHHLGDIYDGSEPAYFYTRALLMTENPFNEECIDSIANCPPRQNLSDIEDPSSILTGKTSLVAKRIDLDMDLIDDGVDFDQSFQRHEKYLVSTKKKTDPSSNPLGFGSVRCDRDIELPFDYKCVQKDFPLDKLNELGVIVGIKEKKWILGEYDYLNNSFLRKISIKVRSSLCDTEIIKKVLMLLRSCKGTRTV